MENDTLIKKIDTYKQDTSLVLYRIKKISTIVFLVLFFLTTLLTSCHKSPGAICNDGHRSYSTGRGTCSHHGGVDHYIDTDEISIPKTAGLIVVIVVVGRFFYATRKEKNE